MKNSRAFIIIIIILSNILFVVDRIYISAFVDFYLLLNASHRPDKFDFRSLKELPVSTCTITSSTLYVGTLLAFGSYMGFAKLNKFSSLNIFPVHKLVSANGSGCDCSESTYKTEGCNHQYMVSIHRSILYR